MWCAKKWYDIVYSQNKSIELKWYSELVMCTILHWMLHCTERISSSDFNLIHQMIRKQIRMETKFRTNVNVCVNIAKSEKKINEKGNIDNEIENEYLTSNETDYLINDNNDNSQ